MTTWLGRRIASAAGEPPRTIVVRVDEALTLPRVAPLCRAVEAALASAAPRLVLDLLAAERCDVVGLAALLQACRRAAAAGRRVEVRVGAALRPALLRARLAERVPLADDSVRDPAPTTHAVDAARPAPVAVGRHVRLRVPEADDLALFARWAEDGLLDQMVGSRLLYCCRHLGPGHPIFVEHALHDPTALALLVEPFLPPRPAGFLRLHAVDLVERFALLEVAPAGVAWPRRGWLVEALLLLLAWAVDVLELARVEAQTCAHDVLGAEALVAAGFAREAVLRGARVYGGRRRDVIVHAVLARDVRERRARAGLAPLSPWSAAP
jgi:ABC-type transporter Mla MlaB component